MFRLSISCVVFNKRGQVIGGLPVAKKGGSYLMNRARHKLEEAAHSYYAQYIVIFFMLYLKRISTTIIDFYEHQHCKVQTKAAARVVVGWQVVFF